MCCCWVRVLCDAVFLDVPVQSFFFILALVSGAALLAALGIELFLHVPVCPLCIYQRWIHVLILVVAIGGAWKKSFSHHAWRACILLYMAGFILAFYHIGLERTWWDFAPFCPSRFAEDGMTPERLGLLLSTPFKETVPCHQVFMRFLGFSLAEWSAGFMGMGSLTLGFLEIKIRSSQK